MKHMAFELVPPEYIGILLTIFIVSGGICLIVGAKKMGSSLIVTGISFPFVTIIVETLFSGLFDMLPPSMVQVIYWFILIFIYLALFGSMMGFLFGEETWAQAKGNLLAGAIKGFLRLAFSKYMLVVWVVLAVYIWLSSKLF